MPGTDIVVRSGDDVAGRRAADARLAWLIVGGSGLATLALLSVLIVWGAQYVSRWAAEQARDMADARRLEGDGGAIPEATINSDTPLPIARGPAPPDTARPIGKVTNWISADDYPPSALRQGWEGRVQVTVAVDRLGMPTGCAVRRSSGHWSLDNATCAVMLNRGRFGADAGGARVRHWTSPPIRWALPDSGEITKKGG